MLMLGNQTIPVKIPPDLNNGEYLEALEVWFKRSSPIAVGGYLEAF